MNSGAVDRKHEAGDVGEGCVLSGGQFGGDRGEDVIEKADGGRFKLFCVGTRAGGFDVEHIERRWILRILRIDDDQPVGKGLARAEQVEPLYFIGASLLGCR